jgi:hypothetical protein
MEVVWSQPVGHKREKSPLAEGCILWRITKPDVGRAILSVYGYFNCTFVFLWSPVAISVSCPSQKSSIHYNGSSSLITPSKQLHGPPVSLHVRVHWTTSVLVLHHLGTFDAANHFSFLFSFPFFVFLRQGLPLEPRLALNLWSTCLSFLRAGIIGFPRPHPAPFFLSFFPFLYFILKFFFYYFILNIFVSVH